MKKFFNMTTLYAFLLIVNASTIIFIEYSQIGLIVTMVLMMAMIFGLVSKWFDHKKKQQEMIHQALLRRTRQLRRGEEHIIEPFDPVDWDSTYRSFYNLHNPFSKRDEKHTLSKKDSTEIDNWITENIE